MNFPYIATGTSKGLVKVWKILYGEEKRTFKRCKNGEDVQKDYMHDKYATVHLIYTSKNHSRRTDILDLFFTSEYLISEDGKDVYIHDFLQKKSWGLQIPLSDSSLLEYSIKTVGNFLILNTVIQEGELIYVFEINSGQLHSTIKSDKEDLSLMPFTIPRPTIFFFTQHRDVCSYILHRIEDGQLVTGILHFHKYYGYEPCIFEVMFLPFYLCIFTDFTVLFYSLSDILKGGEVRVFKSISTELFNVKAGIDNPNDVESYDILGTDFCIKPQVSSLKLKIRIEINRESIEDIEEQDTDSLRDVIIDFCV
jgi:hypothetical protein